MRFTIAARSGATSLSVFVAPLLILAMASEASAQSCIGLPVGMGRFAVQGHVSHAEPGTGYGARLGANFNTPYSIIVDLDRSRRDEVLGTDIGLELAADLHGFEPSVCPTVGLTFRERPLPGGDRATTTMLPLGLGIGRTVGVADGVGLTLFAQPRLLYLLSRPDEAPEGRLGDRLDADGSVGVVLGFPLFFATAGVRGSTVREDATSFLLGLGVRF